MNAKGTTEPGEIDAVLGELGASVSGLVEAVVVTVDGVLLAAQPSTPAAPRFGAIAAAMIGLLHTPVTAEQLGTFEQVLIELGDAFLAYRAVSSSAVVAVAVDHTADIERLGFELARAGMTLERSGVDDLVSSARSEQR
ncbi:MAG: roadblock/LC7 domain-containing protein [Actinomycetota bacterium]|nr:roadblock/LC7 domain-containing protein [Actinomycetota bacterium]